MSVYAFSDVHGCKDIFNAIMDTIGPEDKVYFLGDAADRGPDGWEIIKAILNDPRIIYLKGNHEDLMVKSMKSFSVKTGDLEYPIDDRLFYNWTDVNGGYSTYMDFIKDKSISNEEKKHILTKLENLPFMCVYHNIYGETVYLSHAGFDPAREAEVDEEKAIWDRLHYILNDFMGKDNEVVVHGHTPIELLIHDQKKAARFYNKDWQIPKYEDVGAGAYWYAGGNKVDIDCGTVWSNFSILLNLDTWDEEIFFIEGENMINES